MKWIIIRVYTPVGRKLNNPNYETHRRHSNILLDSSLDLIEGGVRRKAKRGWYKSGINLKRRRAKEFEYSTCVDLAHIPKVLKLNLSFFFAIARNFFVIVTHHPLSSSRTSLMRSTQARFSAWVTVIRWFFVMMWVWMERIVWVSTFNHAICCELRRFLCANQRPTISGRKASERKELNMS